MSNTQPRKITRADGVEQTYHVSDTQPVDRGSTTPVSDTEALVEAADLQERVARARVIISPDTDASNPREERDNATVLALRHSRYTLGDASFDDDAQRALELIDDVHSNGGSWADAYEAIKLEFGATEVAPVYLYDHGGLSVSVGASFSDPDTGRRGSYASWDTSMVGVAFDTAHTRETTGMSPQNARAAIDGDIEVYDQYMRGDTYKLTYIPADAGPDADPVMDGETIHGYFGMDDATNAAKGEHGDDVTIEVSDDPSFPYS